MFLFSHPFLPYFGSSGIRPFSQLLFVAATAHTCPLLFRLSRNVRFFGRIGISPSCEAKGWWLTHLYFLFFRSFRQLAANPAGFFSKYFKIS
jgi:hypothetical protein